MSDPAWVGSDRAAGRASLHHHLI